MNSSLATIFLTDEQGSAVRVDNVKDLSLEYSDGDMANTETRLRYFEPVRIFCGDRMNRKWLIPMKTMSAPPVSGLDGLQVPKAALPGNIFEPVWLTIEEITERHLPMLWMLQPGLEQSDRMSFRGQTVDFEKPIVLVGLCDASGSETYAQFYGLDGALSKEPLKDMDFERKFKYFVTV